MPNAPRPIISLARIDAQCPEVIAGNPAELRTAYVPLPAVLIDRVHALHEKLTYHYAGRDFRLTDVHGNVVHEMIA